MEKREKSVAKETDKSQDPIAESSEAFELLKNQCYVCHSPVSSSHDVIIAPPMAAVKLRYLRSYSSKETFVDAMVSYTMGPGKDAALMKGAVDKFGIMPKQPFQKPDMIRIASYIYEHKLEEPTWFAAHKKEMHAMGFGKGKGKSSKIN